MVSVLPVFKESPPIFAEVKFVPMRLRLAFPVTLIAFPSSIALLPPASVLVSACLRLSITFLALTLPLKVSGPE